MVSDKFIEFYEYTLAEIEKDLTAKNIDKLLGVAKLCVEEFKDIEYATETISKKCKELIIEKHFESDLYTVLNYSDFLRKNKQRDEYVEELWKILLFEAQQMRFDSYLLYLEKNRDSGQRFYFPKRKCFLKIGLIQALQDMLDDKLDTLSISLPPGTGKSTVEKFFHSGVCGWFPSEYSLFVSHSAGITRMYYDGVYSILSDTNEYTWNEIFPDCQVTNTNAKLEQITINEYKPFPNVQTASVGSEMAGKVRASKFLFVDDLIGKLEEALNKNTLDKLWNFYSTDALQRKTVDSNDKPCKEIHIATRWSVHDVIGRLQRELADDKRAKFIAVPDIDPETGKSNFNYDSKGMDEEFFHKQERFMDDISYRCLYKNDPIEREGLLYHDDELRRYVSLPDREPDAIVGVCDTKTTGKDYMVLPVFYQYDEDFYLVDTICDNSADFGIQENRLTNIILEHNMQQCEFESNAGGGRLAVNIEEKLKKAGSRCNITTKPTETNKETRIIVNSDWIKKHVLFRVKENYGVKTDYSVFMNFLLSYSVAGKNTFDDVPDAMANFALFITNKRRQPQTVMIMRSPI